MAAWSAKKVKEVKLSTEAKQHIFRWFEKMDQQGRGDGNITRAELAKSLAKDDVHAALTTHVEGMFPGTGAAPLTAGALWPHFDRNEDGGTSVLEFLNGLSTFASARAYAIENQIDLADPAIEAAYHLKTAVATRKRNDEVGRSGSGAPAAATPAATPAASDYAESSGSESGAAAAEVELQAPEPAPLASEEKSAATLAPAPAPGAAGALDILAGAADAAAAGAGGDASVAGSLVSDE